MVLAVSSVTRSVVFTDGASRLVHHAGPGRPLLVIPSMLQRAHILDLIPGKSLISACREVANVFVLDWGDLGNERGLTFDDALARVARMARRIKRLTNAWPALLGYSQGGTLAAIHAALEPDTISGLALVAAPISFAHGGVMAPWVDPRLVDANLLADAGGVPGPTFRALVAAMHPGASAWSAAAAAWHPDHEVRAHMTALEDWANDAVPLPPEVLRTWLGRLVQRDALWHGDLAIGARRVKLEAITAKVLLAVAEGDTICPPAATLALAERIPCATLRVPGGHVSGVAGLGAHEQLHRPIARWLVEGLAKPG